MRSLLVLSAVDFVVPFGGSNSSRVRLILLALSPATRKTSFRRVGVKGATSHLERSARPESGARRDLEKLALLQKQCEWFQ